VNVSAMQNSQKVFADATVEHFKQSIDFTKPSTYLNQVDKYCTRIGIGQYHKNNHEEWSAKSAGEIELEHKYISEINLAEYLLKKKKNCSAHTMIVKIREEKEMKEGTFKPAVNSKSKKIVAEIAPKFSPLHHPKSPKEHLTPEIDHPSMHHPQISPLSRALAERQERRGPVHDRLQQHEMQRRKKLEELALEKQAREAESVTGMPKLGRNTNEIMRRRSYAGEILALSSGVVRRLGEIEVRAQERQSLHCMQIPPHAMPSSIISLFGTSSLRHHFSALRPRKRARTRIWKSLTTSSLPLWQVRRRDERRQREREQRDEQLRQVRALRSTDQAPVRLWSNGRAPGQLLDPRARSAAAAGAHA
jgi:hypothetical protein